MASASALVSVLPLSDVSFAERKVSCEVWRAKAPGTPGTGMTAKDSSGETASDVADSWPILLLARYLPRVSNRPHAALSSEKMK